jgi:hypothetical protein
VAVQWFGFRHGRAPIGLPTDGERHRDDNKLVVLLDSLWGRITDDGAIVARIAMGGAEVVASGETHRERLGISIYRRRGCNETVQCLHHTIVGELSSGEVVRRHPPLFPWHGQTMPAMCVHGRGSRTASGAQEVYCEGRERGE